MTKGRKVRIKSVAEFHAAKRSAYIRQGQVLHTSLKEANVCLNLGAPASAFDTLVTKHRIILTRDDHLDHRPKVDQQLTTDEEPKQVFLPPASASELEQVQTEGDAGESGAHDASRLSDVFPLHCFDPVSGCEALLVPTKAIVDGLGD